MRTRHTFQGEGNAPMGEQTRRQNATHIANRMTEQGQQTTAFFRSLRPEDFAVQVYSEGTNWTVRDILCHFVSAERALLRLFQSIVAGEGGVVEDFDLDRFNQSQVAKMAGVGVDDLLTQFAESRAAMLAFVEGLDDSALDIEGRHPWFGNDRLEKYLKLVYRHNMLHERDIRRALGGDPE